MKLTQLFALFVLLLKRLFADEAVPLAGNIAFRMVFSLFPFLIFLTSLAGFFGSAELAQGIIKFLLSVMPAGLVNPFTDEITSILTIPRADLLSLAAVLTVWSAMGGVDSVRLSLNRGYDIRETRSIWLLYMQNVLFVIATAVIMLAVAMLLVALPALTLALQVWAPHTNARFFLHQLVAPAPGDIAFGDRPLWRASVFAKSSPATSCCHPRDLPDDRHLGGSCGRLFLVFAPLLQLHLNLCLALWHFCRNVLCLHGRFGFDLWWRGKSAHHADQAGWQLSLKSRLTLDFYML